MFNSSLLFAITCLLFCIEDPKTNTWRPGNTIIRPLFPDNGLLWVFTETSESLHLIGTMSYSVYWMLAGSGLFARKDTRIINWWSTFRWIHRFVSVSFIHPLEYCYMHLSNMSVEDWFITGSKDVSLSKRYELRMKMFKCFGMNSSHLRWFKIFTLDLNECMVILNKLA